MENDVSVSLVDQDVDEDLLEYDEGKNESSNYDDGGRNGLVNVVSEDDIRKAAEVLLQKPSPKVFLKYHEDTFFLFDCNNDPDNNEDEEVIPIILEDPKEIHQNFTNLFVSIRHFLESYYGKLAFMSKEILFDIPSLDIKLCEDNVYNSQITFNDIHTIFSILKERSDAESETEVPPFLEALITTRTRFVSRYNALVELAQSSGTFKNIQPFSNDKTHPLILDDGVGAPESQVIIMSVDDENVPMQDVELAETRTTGQDSDELLEIVENESETIERK
ncbi:hypothetical protein HG535_0G05100 [Zygotorulaspora mrakii]|uniref:Reduced meiotic recombination protein 1 n=1 Tax=Zygotorulaspora mrakii TaxID=42260 RepID=A0A7H9B7N9_ZYGMR|nr:uncharacterized protein HG535_0G05100 [Zygotorulaspora mrakii]QLG74627.1 hypothetical protein HG535_0G05100 [Zygotorulaspora mrakii]